MKVKIKIREDEETLILANIKDVKLISGDYEDSTPIDDAIVDIVPAD